MNVTITNDAILLIVSLTLIFFPQMHLNLVFAICLIFGKLSQACAKIIELVFYYGWLIVLLCMVSYVFCRFCVYL